METLKVVAGGYEAFMGRSKLQLKVCRVQGSKAPVAPEVVAEFQHAPPEVMQQVRELESAHINQFEDILAHLASPDSLEVEADPGDEGTAPASVAFEEKTCSFDSLNVKAQAKIQDQAPVQAQDQA